MHSLYWVQVRRHNIEFYNCKSEHWLQTEYDGKVLCYWRLPNGIYIVKVKKDDGLDCDNDVKNMFPIQLGAFILSNTKWIMNIFTRDTDGFYNIVFTMELPIHYMLKRNIGMF